MVLLFEFSVKAPYSNHQVNSMQEKTSPKRFVAGAVCPKCQTMDTTVCYYEDNIFVRECLDCGFHEKIGHDEEPDDKSKPQIIKVKEL